VPRSRRFALALSVAALAAGALVAMPDARAQLQMMPDAPPALGTVGLDAASLTAPGRRLDAMAGGQVQVPGTLGTGCLGWVPAAPSVALRLTALVPVLAISAQASLDTTLVVRLPDGTYSCNDDYLGTNPVAVVGGAPAGTYTVWIGTYQQQTAQIPVALTFASSAPQQVVQGPGPPQPGPVVGRMDPAATPRFGDMTAQAAIRPDPRRIAVTSGGDQLVDRTIGGSCLGYVTTEPSYRVTLGRARRFLTFWVEAGGTDTTLVIQQPDGSFICNDDCNGLEPSVEIQTAAAGVYNVWVGSYHQGQQHAGELRVSGRRTPKRRNRC
jgi:hypothetical protein